LSPRWKSRFGVANKHEWPTGFIAVKGSSEVSKAVRNTVGAIGYIDYNYVVEDGLVGVQLRNSAGNYVAASMESFRSAVVKSRWNSVGDFSDTLTNMAGNGTWPITMGTYVAMPKVASDNQRAAQTLRFFTWAYANGDALANQAKFIPLPDKVQANAFREICKRPASTVC
jgi:phosphate transport system substrate-binding protein